MKNWEEINKEGNMTLEELDKRIWIIFDILRSDYITSEDYYILLFLISLYKDGILSNDTLSFSNNTEISENLMKSIFNSDNLNDKEYSKPYPYFETNLNNLSKNGLLAVLRSILTIDLKTLSDNFPEIFDKVLFQITQAQGRIGGEFLQPKEITRFIYQLADLPQNAKVFNPFAGLASFGIYLNHNQSYFGQEINQKTWALGKLRLMAYKKVDNAHYVCDNSILHWPDQSNKFDLVVASPPFGMRLNEHEREMVSDIRTIEEFLVKKGVEALNDEGKLIALLSNGFLFRDGSEKRLRENLIERDLIETIIALPGGLLLNTGIPLVILVIKKNKKLHGKVRLINAERFVETKSSREKVLNDFDLVQYIQNSEKSYLSKEFGSNRNVVNESNAKYDSKDADLNKFENGNVERLIETSTVKEFDYNLNIPKYFQVHFEGVKLRDILEYYNGQRINLPKEGKLIRTSNLKDDKVDFKLDLTQIEVTSLERPKLRLVNESCILIASRWKTLKPTLFEFSEIPIFLIPQILSFKVNEKLADPAYVINELHADYVLDQLDAHRSGSIIPIIRRDDLLEVVIKLPSLEEQRGKMQGIAEVSDKIKMLQSERNALAHGKKTRQFNEFASLKHTLGRPRQNILDWTDNLLQFLSDRPKGFDALNQSFLNYYETGILSALQEIKRDVNFMTEVLEKGENGFVVEEYDKTIISFSDINNLINELSSNGFNFKIKKLLLKGEKLKERGIQGNRILLKTLIDNLLTNAHKYGFPKKVAGNEVVFELKEIDDYLSIEVRNNGKPFPRNFDREKFIAKYSTVDSKSGSGLGGYDIHRIAIEFNNPEWELILNEDPIYPVKFKFLFPIKLIN